MSEFSESYHLKTQNIFEAEDLLRKSGVGGFVGKSCDNWVVILPENDDESTKNKLIQNNPGILLYYTYAEDHCFAFAFFEKNKMIGYYSNVWDPICKENIELNSLKISQALKLDVDKQIKLEKILKLFHRGSESNTEYNDEQNFEVHYDFMEVLGIPPEAYSWLSYDYALSDKKEGNIRNLEIYEIYPNKDLN